MSKAYAWSLSLVCVLLGSSLHAAEPANRVVYESWDAAYLSAKEGPQKAGYFHTIVHEKTNNGQKILSTTLDMNLTIRRFKNIISMRMISGTEETADGKVTGVSMTQFLGKEQQMVLTGTVMDDQLRVKVNGKYQMDKKIRWNDKVIGLYRQQLLFKDRKVKPGDSFSYLSYEPSFNTVVTVQATVKNEEEVQVFQNKKRLLRVDAKPEKIEIQGGSIQLPSMTWWLDKEYQPLRAQSEIPGLGTVILFRATREAAMAPGVGDTDIGLTQSIKLNRRLPRPHDTDSVVYRISLPKDDEPGTAFARDVRQEVKNVMGSTFELHIKSIREPQSTTDPEKKIGDEYLKSNFFLNSADAKVQEHARRAVGKESDPWKKAQLVEKWVHNNMKVLNFTEAMATADHVARTLEGDCSEFSMLAAAMCRAAGVPSRIAIGLVYAEMPKGPMLAYHMWTEVWVRGQWVTIDATLGRGSIGAAHLKITDHSWHDVQTLTPLLPVMRVMLGEPKIDIIRINGVE